MVIDINAKSVQLLEKIANCVHERDTKNPRLLCFTNSELRTVELWLTQYTDEIIEAMKK